MGTVEHVVVVSALCSDDVVYFERGDDVSWDRVLLDTYKWTTFGCGCAEVDKSATEVSKLRLVLGRLLGLKYSLLE